LERIPLRRILPRNILIRLARGTAAAQAWFIGIPGEICAEDSPNLKPAKGISRGCEVIFTADYG
jgi:hypothetical protein